MTLKTLFKLILKVLDSQDPDKAFKSKSGEHITIRDLKEALNNLCKWIYPSFDTKCIEAVVRCEECRHYKKFKKEDAFKGATYWACDIDMSKRLPDFYCKDGDKNEAKSD